MKLIAKNTENAEKDKIMKSRLLMIGILVATVAIAPAATNDLGTALQKALFEEEGNHNLSEAIRSYSAVVTQFDETRNLAATALFRLGECYRKLGKTNDALVQYERILRNFSDQENLVALSRKNLDGLGGSAEISQRRMTVEDLRHFEGIRIETRAEMAREENLLSRLKALTRPELIQALPTVAQDNLLSSLLEQLTVAEQELVRLQMDFGPEHVEVKKTKSSVKDLRARIDNRADGILLGLDAKVGALKANLQALENEIEKTARSQITP